MSDYTDAEARLIQSRNQQSTQSQSTDFSVDQPTTPKITNKPQAKNVDLQGMASRVNEAAREQQATSPTVFDTIDKDMPWLKWVAASLGVLGAAQAAKSLFGGGNPPDDNNPPNNRPRSPRDRSFNRVEPTMDTGPVVEPTPTQQSRQFTPTDVTDVASRPVGTERAQLPGPQQQPAVATPQATPTGVPSALPQFTVAGQPQAQMQYGATAYNQPTGTPSPLGAPPPAETPVKPIDPVAQARIDAINAAEARKQAAFEAEQRRKDAAEARAQQAHEAKIAKQSAASLQKQQGKPLSDVDAQLIKKGAEITVDKASVAQKEAFAKQVAAISGTSGPAVTPPAAAPAAAPVQLTPSPEVMAETPVTKPVVPAPEKVIAAEKAALKWPGGSEGSALQQFFGATKKTLAPEHMAGLEMFKDYIGGELAPSTGGTIKEIGKANEFVTKYSGKPLPVGENGKLQRLPEQQIADIHAGIRSELETAVKGGKLSTLSKGAMAAVGLLGLTGAVQAAQKGDFGPLEEAGFSGLLGKVIGGTAATLLTPFEAAAPVVGYTKQEQQIREVSQRPGVRAYAEMLKNRLSGEEYNKAIAEFAAKNPKRGDYAAMQELFRQQAEAKKSKK